jgi:hypothetical protein
VLGEYVLVQLYTDYVPSKYEPTTSAEENKKLRDEVFKNAQLPLYAIVKPTGNGRWEEVARYEGGKINDADGFADFLRKPLPTR